MLYIILTIAVSTLFILGYIFLYILNFRIEKKEKKLIWLFVSRTNLIPAIYEVASEHIMKHKDIFKEILSLRKKEFSLQGISNDIESFIEVEQYIHHEINFIFQVCNKTPALLKEKHFLYMRDIMMKQSASIGKEIRTYNKIIEIYNNIIKYKNYSLVGFFLPFNKKATL